MGPLRSLTALRFPSSAASSFGGSPSLAADVVCADALSELPGGGGGRRGGFSHLPAGRDAEIIGLLSASF